MRMDIQPIIAGLTADYGAVPYEMLPFFLNYGFEFEFLYGKCKKVEGCNKVGTFNQALKGDELLAYDPKVRRMKGDIKKTDDPKEKVTFTAACVRHFEFPLGAPKNLRDILKGPEDLLKIRRVE